MTLETIDYSKVYRIEAVPNRDIKELAEKGLSTYPGITQLVTAAWSDRLKRYINTGFDENASEILTLPLEERKKVQERITKKREEIEALMANPGYLKPTSDAWLTELCMVEIEVGQDLKVRVNGHDNVLRPTENYKDAISLTLLMNCPTFPKKKSDLGDPSFKNARFYLTTDDEIAGEVKTSLTKRKQAYVKLSELFDSGKNKQRAWEIGFKLGIVNKQKIDHAVLEQKIHDSIFNDKTGKTLDAFLEACELDNATLAIHNTFQQGINLGIIRVSVDGTYHRGVSNYRKTKGESIAYLMTAGNEIELAELRSAVEERKKKHNAVG